MSPTDQPKADAIRQATHLLGEWHSTAGPLILRSVESGTWAGASGRAGQGATRVKAHTDQLAAIIDQLPRILTLIGDAVDSALQE